MLKKAGGLLKTPRWRSACRAAIVLLSARWALAEDGPQWRGPERDGVWRETGVIGAFSGPRLEHEWGAEVSNGFAGPTVADGRVYVTDRVTEPQQMERVLCFVAATGEKLWLHEYACR